MIADILLVVITWRNLDGRFKDIPFVKRGHNGFSNILLCDGMDDTSSVRNSTTYTDDIIRNSLLCVRHLVPPQASSPSVSSDSFALCSLEYSSS